MVIYRLSTPEVKETPDASEMAKGKLAEMGPMTLPEKKMIVVFILILVLWIAGSSIDLDATATGFIGLGVLLLSGVLTWDDVKSEKGAWDTLVWFSALVMMAGQLNTLGMIPWFGDLMGGLVGGLDWIVTLARPGACVLLRALPVRQPDGARHRHVRGLLDRGRGRRARLPCWRRSSWASSAT